MTKIFCDHCGKEINGFNEYTEYEIEFERHCYPCDLCKECLEAIDAEIDKRIMTYLGWGKDEK